MRLLLGERRDLTIDPQECRRLAEILEGQPPEALDAVADPAMRRLLWEALAHVHPWYVLAWEATRSLGWEDNPEWLRTVLRTVQRVQQALRALEPRGPAESTRQITVSGHVDLSTRTLLVDLLRYQGLTTFEEVVAFFQTMPVRRRDEEDAMLDHDWVHVHARSLMEIQVRGSVDRFEWLMHQAFALQRAGYEASLVFPTPRQTVRRYDLQTMTSVDELLLLVRDRPDVQRWYALGDPLILQGLGLPRAPGIVELTAEAAEALRAEALDRPVFPMRQCSTCSWDPLPYLAAFERVVADEHGRWAERDAQAWFEPVRGFLQSHHQQVRDAMARLFDAETLRHGIRVVTEGPLSGDRLSERKATVAVAFRLLPPSLFNGLRIMRLLAEPEIILALTASVTAEGRVERTWKEQPVVGHHRPQQVTQATSTLAVSTHEIIHHWHRELAKGADRLFLDISWAERVDGTWRLRAEPVQLDHFFGHEYALTNGGEDLAVAGGLYVTQGPRLRTVVRDYLAQGDVVPAAKYLFVKYLIMQEKGLAFEYGLSEHSRPVTFEEVLRAIPEIPSPEQQWLQGLIVQIRREAERRQRGSRSGLEERDLVVTQALAQAALQQVPQPLASPVGTQVLVFTTPELLDLVPLAVQWGWLVAVSVDGPEADAVGALLARLPEVRGRYAVGTSAMAAFVEQHPAHRPIPIKTRQDAYRLLGLPLVEGLPAPVAAALDAIQQYLTVSRQLHAAA